MLLSDAFSEVYRGSLDLSVLGAFLTIMFHLKASSSFKWSHYWALCVCLSSVRSLRQGQVHAMVSMKVHSLSCNISLNYSVLVPNRSGRSVSDLDTAAALSGTLPLFFQTISPLQIIVDVDYIVLR